MHVKLIVIVLLFLPGIVYAGKLHLVINGKAYHFDRDLKWNERNYGLGFEYEYEPQGNWIWFTAGSTFKDSNNQTSSYLGGGLRRRYLLGDDPQGLHVDVGAVAFLMTRKDFNNHRPFPGVLPFVSVGNEWLAMNMVYIPRVTPKLADLLFFQLRIKMAEFD